MVIMESYYTSPDRFHDLCQEIERCHLSYLELEESNEKIDQRNKLEEYIRDFLCVAAHYQKFTFHESAEVLQRSASSKRDFSGYKAASGFNAIQLYAGNLLAQPWRKEYRQIRVYCGFYKHQIEANLVGAELLFEAMGYKHFGDGLLILEGPICPDRVAAVSRDCLVAYVECQILKAIWEEASTAFKISWLEVLEFRKHHVCSPEQSIKGLKYKHHQRQYQEHTRSHSQGSEAMFSGRQDIDPSFHARYQGVPIPVGTPVHPLNHSFPPLSSHHHVGLPPSNEYIYTNGCCQNGYTPYGPTYAYLPCPQPIIKPQINTNGYFYNGHAPAPAPALYQYGVPTAKLIEVESQNGSYDVVDKPMSKPLRHIDAIQNDLYKSKNNNERVSERNDTQLEEWDYVFRNLESQGYSKDLGERGDVLSPKAKEMRRVRAMNVDESFNNLAIADRSLKVNDSLKRIDRDKKPIVRKVDKQTSPNSSYDNLPQEEVKKPVCKTPVMSSTMKQVTPNKSMATENRPLPSKTVGKKAVVENGFKQQEVALPSKSNSDKWQCKSCTYLNGPGKEICDICSKSRTPKTERPMEIGGSECSHCTLVNPKTW